MEKDNLFSPDDCLKLRQLGYPQGISRFLWHRNKHNHDQWELYARNKHDISNYGDKLGYNRWVSAAPIDNPFREITSELINSRR